MLLQAKNPLLRRSGAAGISFIGSAVDNVGNGGTCIIDLTTITGIAQNDIIIALAGSTGGTAATPSGYTSITTDTSPIMSLSYKIQTATPDTSITFWDTGSNTHSGASLALVFRGVDTANPLDVALQENAITPVSNNCCIVVMGVQTGLDTDIGTITNYLPDPAVQIAGNDDNDFTVGAVYQILVGGAGVEEDPNPWSSWTPSQNYIIALRPAT